MNDCIIPVRALRLTEGIGNIVLSPMLGETLQEFANARS